MENSNNQEMMMEAFVEEINAKYAEPKEKYDNAYNAYIDLLIQMQEEISSVYLDSEKTVMTEKTATTISRFVNEINDSEFIKLFAGSENSPVINSVKTAKALWDAACCTMANYAKHDYSENEKLGFVLHVTASLTTAFELLQHAISFANFEDTIDKQEYMEMYNKFISMLGDDDLTATIDHNENEDN